MNETSAVALRRRRGREEVDALVVRYRQSGMSAAHFCEQERVPISSLYKWLRRDRARSKGCAVVEVPWMSSPGQWTLCWPDGRRLLIPYDAPAMALGPVLRVLDDPA